MFELNHTFDEYIEELEQKSKLTAKTDGMIIIDDSYKLYKQTIIKNNKIIFPHPFLRKNGCGNFDTIIHDLNKLFTEGNKVKIRLDPFENRDISELSSIEDILEHDFWYGPKFSNNIFDSNQEFSPTLHTTNDDDIKQFMDYPVKYTIFRPSCLDKDKNIVQYYIEELLLPKDEEKNSLYNVPYCSDKYVAQKFVHFTYDRNNKFFEHIDGSVRIFKSGYWV